MVSKDIIKGNVATEDHNTQRNTDESDILVGLEETIIALKNLKKIIVISCVMYIIVRCFLKFTGSKFNKWMEILIGGMLFTFLLFFWVETKQFAGCSLESVCGIDRLLLGSRPKSERKINIFSFLIMIMLSITDIHSSTFICSLIMTTKNAIDLGIFWH